MRQLSGRKAALRAALLIASILALALTCGAPPAAALTLDGPEAAIGIWNLTTSPGPNSCRLTLRGEQVHGGFFVGMPPACRHALPVLANVVAWMLPGDNHLDLADPYGKPLLDFKQLDDGRLAAAGPQGVTYFLVFVEGAAAAPTNLPAAAPAATQTAAAAKAPRAILRPADVAGRYAVLREAGRDTGCMVTLDISTRAFLSPACRDQGIVIFDPTGWRMAGGHLVIVARKGHTAELDLQADGTWLKESKDAAARSLALKKL